MDSMGIGLPLDAAALWKTYNIDEYTELFVEEDDEYAYFVQFPSWCYDEELGPFFIDDNGAIWAISANPSIDGELIGRLPSQPS